MTDICCANCGTVINDPIDQYGEEDWILCRSCDWEIQAEWKFDNTRRTIDAGHQTTYLEEQMKRYMLALILLTFYIGAITGMAVLYFDGWTIDVLKVFLVFFLPGFGGWVAGSLYKEDK